MKNVNKGLISLRVFCVVVWVAVAVMISCLCSKVFANQKDIPSSEIAYEVVYKENKKELPPMLQKSIDLCKEEYNFEIAHAVYDAAAKYSIPHYVIYAIIATESGMYGTKAITQDNVLTVNYKAVSNCDCRGLMQISIYAIKDYNKIHGTKYTLDDMFDVYKNIDVGTWYYSQFRSVASTWTEMYVIYNVGYGFYNRINSNWFYDYNGVWHNDYRNSFFLMNGFMPPTDSNKGLYGKNHLPVYGPKARFEKCLDLCFKHFYN